MEELPYKVEYAKTGRAKCRGCKINIEKDELRLAALVQSFFHDGKDCHWFHLNCFFQKHRPKAIDDIDHFEEIRIEDQENIRQKLDATKGILLPEPKGKKKGKKRAAEDSKTAAFNATALNDFGVEYAKSGRSACAGCGNNIMVNEVRIKKMDYTTEVGMKFGGQPFWHHVDCFAKIRGDYNFYLDGSDLPGFSELSPADKKIVKKAIKAIEITEAQAKKLKTEPRDKDEVEAENALEKLITEQTKLLFKVRDEIQFLKKSDLQNILFVNDSGMVSGSDALIERCSDFLTFGAIKKCKKCKNGDMIFAKYGYRCNGNIDEWTMCENFEEKPERVKCKIPKELKESKGNKKSEKNFFAKYKSLVKDRAVRPQIKKEIKKDEEDGKRIYKVEREREPLYGMHCVLISNNKGLKEELKTKITRLGGKVVTTLQEHIAFVISNNDEVEKMNKRMQEVKSLDIQVVDEKFIDAIEKLKRAEVIEKIKSMSICDWGSDPLTRIPAEEEKKTERESIYNRNKKKTAVMKLKNGTAIDPASGLSDVAHVYKDKLTNILYTTVLTKIDIQKNKNSYYKLQVLESDMERNYWLFRSWGRIGTDVGDNKTEKCFSVEEAITEFERLFEEKTGNIFGAPFQKKPNSYTLVEVDYENEDEKNKKKEELEKIPSKLPTSVQDLVKMIFDIDTMKKTMLEFELDLEKMPLGRLSSKQLHEAYTVLNDLDELIKSGDNNESKFIGFSNKFFSLVPHSFGMNKAPVINTVEMIKQKREMIDSLMEIEIAYAFIKDDEKSNTDVNPLDAHYAKLKTDLKPLDKNNDEFKLIESYIKNTHAETHNQYTLEIEDVFKVKRENEHRRYKPFKKLHNRQLLWHGSRLTNYVGILSHGLKIAPPEAPCTGYMFGKGVYFADMVSKSANYCCTSPRQPIGLMLLSEVALGDMYELTNAKYINKLPPGKHSCKGIGKTSPNPEQFQVREDGVTIPCGQPKTNDKLRSELLYNEYIVYDVAQVNIQYLLKLKFNYKRQ
ncbi:hypothetical protein PVAND_003458 [Polypedilum vanderplanki]|uniref:Poly [ADP-ribose] polymerase n=1 Tax=Polypedilum vanderplanki TaxID=319348 RepID=A0A9J6BV53_POLVA|nr:hypothetical protein PVAND_003458 [Polypedilum vanderplanki]